MYYPNGAQFPDVGVTEVKVEADDVLDLCVRKSDKEEKKVPAIKEYNGDVNGNGYAENPNGFYKGFDREKGAFHCKSPEMERQQWYIQPPRPRSDASSSPTILQEKLYADAVADRIHPVANSTSPAKSPPFVADAPLFQTLPTTKSTATNRNGKPTRPFKAYPNDFLALATSEGLLDDSNKRYMEFRRQFLTQLHVTTGLSSNRNMKRPVQSDSPNQLPSSSGDAKDQAYWERRKKNNEAAKKSRDARRAKEDEIAIRAAFLERENVRLKLELASLRSETDRLRCMLYTS